MRKLDDFVPPPRPLRSIRVMANEDLAKMDRIFAGMCDADIKGGRPSIAPEKLLRAMLLQVLYGIRSERQLMGKLNTACCFGGFLVRRWTIRALSGCWRGGGVAGAISSAHDLPSSPKWCSASQAAPGIWMRCS
ncbi:hypothetical protein BN2476_630046 [Paraburkholderia piptadeniae]|uniref:Transposase InsH N-terminal domain-containing protein n=1 Tax=Paraburkholderia piptadeniae TaxID=1701573 RepID=A0A1N7SLI8_9BURK|nr:hypothetical protein BN2476_630046 [Paraburkholderia piptadeniae]